MAEISTWMWESLAFMVVGLIGGLVVKLMGAPDWGILAGIASWMLLAVTFRLIWIMGDLR